MQDSLTKPNLIHRMRSMGKRFLIAAVLTTVILVVSLVSPLAAFAVGPSFNLYPSTGYALLGKEFATDIMLDTGSEDLTMARAVFRFNPAKVRVTKAEHGDLFCQYPEDEYTVDNSLGWVKLTGFCLDPYYNSLGTEGLFGRITFVPLVEGETTFKFVQSYEDDEWESTMKDAGSPPLAVTGIAFSGGTYTVVSSIDGAQPVDGTLPGVGIFDDTRIVIGMAFVGAAGAILLGSYLFGSVRRRRKASGERTVVV